MSFAMDLQAFRDKVDRRTHAVVKSIVLRVGVALVMKSPVGDADYWIMPAPEGYTGGRFRANWQYHLNSADSSTNEKTDKSGGPTIASIQAKVSDRPAGGVHYITNSLPYARRLEEGWSHRQAPHGMIAITVVEFRPIVAAAVRELK